RQHDALRRRDLHHRDRRPFSAPELSELEREGTMSEPFIGEIRPFAFGAAPRGWLPCNGQLLSIQQNQALYSLLGTTYGGDGVTTFALPDLRGRVAAHPGGSVGNVGSV